MNDIPEHHSDRIEMILSLGVSKWKNQNMAGLQNIRLQTPEEPLTPFQIDFQDNQFVKELARIESNKRHQASSDDVENKSSQMFVFGRQTGKTALKLSQFQFTHQGPEDNRAKRRGQTQPKRLPGQQYLDLKKR